MTELDRSLIALRRYEPIDAAVTLSIFTDAITQTAAAHYSPEQIEVWARSGRRDPLVWHEAMSRRASVVAVIDGEVVGFSDVDGNGYIDMLFVSPAVQRRGVARVLLGFIEQKARGEGIGVLSSDVSITACPFFEYIGFVIVREQQHVKEGVALTNYLMTKVLASTRADARSSERLIEM